MSNYTDASLIYYPSGYKASKAYSLKPTDGSGDLTFTRASTATRVNAEGLIESVAANVPRLDNSQGGCSTLLLEPQRTNVIKQSQDYTTGDYIFSNITSININFATSPSGVLNSQKVNFGTGSSYLRSKESLASALSCSIFAKYVDYPYLQIMIGGDSEHYANFDVQNGTIGNVGTKSTASIEDYGDGWYRIVINSLSGTFGSAPRIYKIENLLASWALGGGAAGSCLLWGFQYELGSYATSYIPTTTTAVTRVADSASKSGISSLIGQTEGTMFVEIELGITGATNRIIALNDGTAFGNLNMVSFNPQARFQLEATPVNITTTNTYPAGLYKAAIVYSPSGCAIWVNGSQAATTATATTTTNYSKLFVGNSPYGVGQNKRISQTMIFKTRLSDADLIALTTL